jgi:hypothetical protein
MAWHARHAMTDAPHRTPHGSETRQRSRLVQVRCTPDEQARIEAAAERAGMSVASFMRHQCLGTPGPRAQRRPPVERAALAQLLAWLGKAGSNVNQIARVGNTTGDLPPGVDAARADLRAAAGAILTTLGKRS